MPALLKSRLTDYDINRNHALLALIQSKTNWDFSINNQAKILANLTIKVHKEKKSGIALTDLSQKERVKLLEYLSGQISLSRLTQYFNTYNKKLVKFFAENHLAIRYQYDYSKNAHDKKNIADLLDNNINKEKMIFKEYGYLHVPDVYAAMRPLEEVEGVCVLTGRANFDSDEIESYLASYKIIIIPENKESGSHWTIKAYKIENNTLVEIKPADINQKEGSFDTIANGYCGDDANRIGFRIVKGMERELDLKIPAEIKKLHEKLEAAGNNDQLRYATIDAIKYGKKLEEAPQKNVSDNEILAGKDRANWTAAVNGFIKSKNSDKKLEITKSENAYNQYGFFNNSNARNVDYYRQALECQNIGARSSKKKLNTKNTIPITLNKEAFLAIQQQYQHLSQSSQETPIDNNTIIDDLAKSILEEQKLPSQEIQKQIATDYVFAVKTAIDDLKSTPDDSSKDNNKTNQQFSC